MFAHNKRLQYTVRVGETNPGLANLMLEQFGGPQGELAAAMRYFTQAVAEDDPGRRDMLYDIATEELSHLEVIGNIVVMLNKGSKAELAEGFDQAGELYRKINGAGNDSHVTQLLYGAGAPLTNSGGAHDVRSRDRTVDRRRAGHGHWPAHRRQKRDGRALGGRQQADSRKGSSRSPSSTSECPRRAVRAVALSAPGRAAPG